MALLNLTESSNARTNWITIALGVIIGVLGFFKIIPDLQTAASLGSDVSSLILYAKTGAWTAVFTVLLNLYNTITHLLKKG
jgi:hypothetical protein